MRNISGRWMAIASTAALLLSACSGTASSTAPASVAPPPSQAATTSAATSPIASGAASCAPASGPINIGIVQNFTGVEALDGQGYAQGTELAIDQLNDAGGIGGQKVTYKELDTASPVTGQPDTSIATSVARQLVADPATVLIIGGTDSSISKAMLPILAQDGLPMITASSTNPSLTDPSQTQFRMADGSPLFFRTVPNDSVLGPAMASYAHEKLGVTSIFFVDDGGPYGVGVGDQVVKAAAQSGITVIGRDRIDPLGADYSVLITKINGLHPDGLMMVTGSGPGGKFAHQAKGVLKGVLFGADNVPDESFVEQSGPGGADGWYGILGAPDITSLPTAQQFVKDFTAKYGRVPGAAYANYNQAATAGLKAIASVVCAGQPLTRDAVRNALKTTSFDGITGPVSFDKNGDRVVKILSIWTIKADKLSYVTSYSYTQ